MYGCFAKVVVSSDVRSDDAHPVGGNTCDTSKEEASNGILTCQITGAEVADGVDLTVRAHAYTCVSRPCISSRLSHLKRGGMVYR